MGMLISNPPTWNFVSDLISDMLKWRPIPGGTKKETDLNEAVYRTKINSYCECLASYGNDLRVREVHPLLELFPDELKDEKGRYSWIPAKGKDDYSVWWRTVKELWDNGLWENTSDEDFYAQMWLEFSDITFDKDWKDYILRIRKQLVKADVLEPEEQDREWIREEWEAIKGIAVPIENLATKLGIS